eukprot:4582243-Prymnesium_polylepis.1
MGVQQRYSSAPHVPRCFSACFFPSFTRHRPGPPITTGAVPTEGHAVGATVLKDGAGQRRSDDQRAAKQPMMMSRGV